MFQCRRVVSLLAALSLSACGHESTVDVPDESEPTAEVGSGLSFQSGERQFAGGFAPRNAPYGGFGGAALCKATRRPVIYVPGNGDEAKNFDFPASTGGASIYAVFRAAGYTDCELFGVNWLTAEQRKSPLKNYHDRQKAEIVADFIRAVREYTGAQKVDLIGHSMGSTVAMHAIERSGQWPAIGRFIAISSAMRGLDSCLSFGYANSLGPVCGSQNFFVSDVFGLYPPRYVSNPRMGSTSAGFRNYPAKATETRFFSIGAGVNDGFLCSSGFTSPACSVTAYFSPASNVRAQLDVGFGWTANQLDYELTDYSLFRAGAGDVNGVGHFRAKNNTGRIQLNMLTTECTGSACCSGYAATCRLASL